MFLRNIRICISKGRTSVILFLHVNWLRISKRYFFQGKKAVGNSNSMPFATYICFLTGLHLVGFG